MVAVTYGKFHMFPLYHAPARTLPLRSSSRATQSPLYWFVPGLDCDIPLAITSAPHKDFPDLYEKMSGKGECQTERLRFLPIEKATHPAAVAEPGPAELPDDPCVCYGAD